MPHAVSLFVQADVAVLPLDEETFFCEIGLVQRETPTPQPARCAAPRPRSPETGQAATVGQQTAWATITRSPLNVAAGEPYSL